MNIIAVIILVVAQFILFISISFLCGLTAEEISNSYFLSDIASPIFSAFVASIIGVMGAQYIVVKMQNDNALRKELLDINNAIMLIKVSVDSLLNFKLNYVVHYKEYTDIKNKDLLTNLENDFDKIPISFFEMDILNYNYFEIKEMVFHRINAVATEMLHTSSMLSKTEKILKDIVRLNTTLQEIEHIYSESDNGKKVALVKYYNIQNSFFTGNDERFSETYANIGYDLDDVIRHLFVLGESLYDRALKNYPFKKLNISLIRFDKKLIAHKELLPNFDNVDSFEKCFL